MLNDKQSKKVFGLGTCISLVVGNMIGSGIFLLPTSLAMFGSVSIISWVFTAVGAILLSLVFAKLSRDLPRTGGPYAFCREGLGDFIGFQVAFCYWIAVMISNAATIIALMSYLSVFYPQLDKQHMLSLSLGIGIIWLITLINIWGTKQVGVIQVVTTILKLIPLIVIATVGLFWVNWDQLFDSFNVTSHSNFAAFSGAAMMTLWAFLGLESATVPAEHVKNPERVIPLATVLGTLIAAVVYILSTIVVMGVISQTLLVDSAAPFSDTAEVIFKGHWAGQVVAFAAILSCFSSTVGWVFLQGEIPMAASKDGLFPKFFAKLSKRGTPMGGLVFSGLIMTAMIAMNYNAKLASQFTGMIEYSVLAFLITYFYSTISELVIFVKHPEIFSTQRLTKSVIICLLAFSYVFWSIMASGSHMVFYGSILLFGCAPFYAWTKWCHRDMLSTISP